MPAVLSKVCCCRDTAAGSSSKGRKKSPEELSVEVLLHFVGTIRAFYSSVAKAVHAQARRRDDPTFQPNASMNAASVTLGVILKRNLLASALQVWLHLCTLMQVVFPLPLQRCNPLPIVPANTDILV